MASNKPLSKKEIEAGLKKILWAHNNTDERPNSERDDFRFNFPNPTPSGSKSAKADKSTSSKKLTDESNDRNQEAATKKKKTRGKRGGKGMEKNVQNQSDNTDQKEGRGFPKETEKQGVSNSKEGPGTSRNQGKYKAGPSKAENEQLDSVNQESKKEKRKRNRKKKDQQNISEKDSKRQDSPRNSVAPTNDVKSKDQSSKSKPQTNSSEVPPMAYDFDPEKLAELAEAGVILLRKKSAKFPLAKFYCKQCDYHCNSLEYAYRHAEDKRHIRRMNLRIKERLLRNLPAPTPTHLAALDKFLEQMYQEISLSEEDVSKRNDAIEAFTALVHSKHPDAEINIYGSLSTGGATQQSDCNIDVVSADRTPLILKDIHLLLKDDTSGKFHGVRSDFSSVNPCMYFKYEGMDINFHVATNSTTAILTSQLLAVFLQIDPRVKKLVVLFRHWAALTKVDDPDTGTLPSYVFALMTVFYLQRCRPAVLPVLHELGKEEDRKAGCSCNYYLGDLETISKHWKTRSNHTLSELWIGMLRFYSMTFDLKNEVINIRTQQIMPRSEKKWYRKLAIEDPFGRKRNVARFLSHSQVFDYLCDKLKTTYQYFGIPQRADGPLFTDINFKDPQSPTSPDSEKSPVERSPDPDETSPEPKDSSPDLVSQKSDPDDQTPDCKDLEDPIPNDINDTESLSQSLSQDCDSIVMDTVPSVSDITNSELTQSDTAEKCDDNVNFYVGDSSPQRRSSSPNKETSPPKNQLTEIYAENVANSVFEEAMGEISNQSNSPIVTRKTASVTDAIVDKLVTEFKTMGVETNSEEKRESSSQNGDVSVKNGAKNSDADDNEIINDLKDCSADDIIDDIDLDDLVCDYNKQESSDTQDSKNSQGSDSLSQVDSSEQKNSAATKSENSSVKKNTDVKNLDKSVINVVKSKLSKNVKGDSPPLKTYNKEEVLSVEENDLVFKFNKEAFEVDEGPQMYCSDCKQQGHMEKDCPMDRLPEIKPLPPPSEQYMNMLNQILLQVPGDFEPTKREVHFRNAVVADLEHFISNIYPGTRLQLFGSSCNGFGFQNSDLDISMTIDGADPEKLDQVDIIENLATKIRRNHREYYNVVAITSAKVPIVKFKHKSQLEGDISLYNTLAQSNTRMLQSYCDIDNRVRVLGYTLKVFAKICSIGDASRGSISSYAYILMVIYFLQQRKPAVIPVLQQLYDGDKPENIVDGWNAWFYNDLKKLPKVWPEYGKNKESLAQLWLGLLRFYTEEFNFEDYVISIRQYQPLTRFEKLWTGRGLAIEDPFDLQHNLGGGVSRKMNNFIRKAFINGRSLFGTTIHKPPHGYRTIQDYLFDPACLTDGLPPNDRGCRVCGEIGHFVKDCPIVLNRKERKQSKRQKKSRENAEKNGHRESEGPSEYRPKVVRPPRFERSNSYSQQVNPESRSQNNRQQQQHYDNQPQQQQYHSPHTHSEPRQVPHPHQRHQYERSLSFGHTPPGSEPRPIPNPQQRHHSQSFGHTPPNMGSPHTPVYLSSENMAASPGRSMSNLVFYNSNYPVSSGGPQYTASIPQSPTVVYVSQAQPGSPVDAAHFQFQAAGHHHHHHSAPPVYHNKTPTKDNTRGQYQQGVDIYNKAWPTLTNAPTSPSSATRVVFVDPNAVKLEVTVNNERYKGKDVQKGGLADKSQTTPQKESGERRKILKAKRNEPQKNTNR